jgi:hypothetical protein
MNEKEFLSPSNMWLMFGCSMSVLESPKNNGSILMKSGHDAMKLVMVNKAKDIISFHYTDDYKDWIDNLRYLRVPVGPLVTIHEGLYTSWIPFKTFLNSYYEGTDRQRKIDVTGYSRGGHFAVLCARHLRKNMGFITVRCMTFGAPRVGGSNFADEYQKLDIITVSVRNGYDIVPVLPPRRFGYVSVGTPFRLKQPFYHAITHRFRDHSRYSYAEKIVERTSEKWKY